MRNPDVLIVGAGPVGLTLAIECQRYGVSFRIIDKAPGHSAYSKALAIWSGTLEHLAVNNLARVNNQLQTVLWKDFGSEAAQVNKLCK